VLGVAWPSVRRTFDLPLSDLGILLAVATGGYVVSSFASGALVARVGVGRLLTWSSAVTAASALDYALAPAWPVMVAGAALAGLGAGAIDAGINAHAAARFSARTINWLHASYGVGAMLGPLMMTSVLVQGLSWRWGYGLIGMALAGMTGCFQLSAGRWDCRRPAGECPRSDADGPGDSFLGTLGRPVVWIYMALFFVYTGLEITAGQWTYSLLTEARGVEMATAGGWISAYWGSLALGRLTVGALASRFTGMTLLRVSMGLAPVAAFLLWSDHGRLADLVSLLMLGVSFAPIFPLLISQTPRRLGAAAGHAIGFQVAAAYLGTATLPGGAGVLARWNGLEVLGPFLVVGSVVLLVLHEVARWWPGRAFTKAEATA
jgi:fucose permease